MENAGSQDLYGRESQILAEIGTALSDADFPNISVRIPRRLAELALEAWNRNYSDAPVGVESVEQRVLRHRAGTLSLIGLSITERGVWDEHGVEVELDPILIGMAVDASDDLPPSRG
jgi:hypothetical protein